MDKVSNRLIKGYLGKVEPLTNEGGITSQLFATLIKKDGLQIDYGLVGNKAVTDTFVEIIVGAMQNNSVPLLKMGMWKLHGSGTGALSEAADNTGLANELGSRVIGSQEEGATANIYKSIATIPYTASYTITEHGIFDGGRETGYPDLLDATLLAGSVAVDNGDSIKFTYQLTFTAGS